ncbi:MAG: tetratricopeptide repeat protein [bacterium]|nr:tetratricopeptide repeat protein [bacterium]
MRRWPSVVLALVASVAAAESPELLPVPEPSLVGMEAAVRAQLSEGLADLRSFRDQPGGDRAELAEAFGGMGQIYLAYDLTAPAEACLRNAHALQPADFRWPYLLGALHQNERRLDEAFAGFEAALELEPRDLAALVRTGNVLLARDEPEAARPYFERAVALGAPRAAALAGLAKVAAAAGEHETAVQHFEAALEEQPEASALHYPLAISLRELGRIDDARARLALRGDVRPQFPDPVAANLLQLATGAGVHLMYGNRALRQGNVEAAAERFRKAVAANPRSAPAQQALGSALYQLGDADGAIRHFSASLALDPENPALHYNLATILVEREQDDQAVRHFQAALSQAPDYHNARYNLATALARMGRSKEAEGHYRTLLETDPTDVGSRFYLAQTLRQLGRTEEAAELLSALVDEEPGRVRARLLLAAVSMSSGDTERAAAQYRAVVDLPSAEPAQRARARRELAGLAARSGSWAEAAAGYGELIALDPRDEQARFGQAMALMLAESYGDARHRLQEGLEALPESASLAHALARLLATCPDAAIRDGDRALQISLSLFRALENPLFAETAAMSLAELGRYEEALTWQRRLISEAERAGGAAILPRLRERLALYERGEPCRAPWLEEWR